MKIIALIAACTALLPTILPAESLHCEQSSALQELLVMLDVHTSPDGHDLVEATQKAWLRPKGLERWQIPEKYSELRAKLLPLFESLGMTKAVVASGQKYDYAAIHGATLGRVRSRIASLVQEYNRGIRFDKIVFLSGERVLDKNLEREVIQKELESGETEPTNEIQMIQWVWQKAKLPTEMHQLPVTFVNAAASDTRAHTADAVKAWFSQNPSPGKILAVSNQPYVAYQDMTLRNKMPQGFSLETIGDASGSQVLNADYLDTLARFLFEQRRS